MTDKFFNSKLSQKLKTKKKTILEKIDTLIDNGITTEKNH